MLFVLPLEAKIAPSNLNDLIHESDLIVRAVTVETHLQPKGYGSGYAVLNVKEVYLGEYTLGKDIKLSWGSEVHDQKIKDIGKERLLFLRLKKAGCYTGTHYGRSYWPINTVLGNNKEFVAYQYPTNRVKIGSTTLLKDGKINLQKLLKQVPTIFKVKKLKVKVLENKIKSYQQSYLQKSKGQAQVIFPKCPATMFRFTLKINKKSYSKICKGANDKAFKIQNGWQADYNIKNRSPVRVDHYKNGLQHGPFKVIYENKDWWQGNYVKGKLHGLRRYWYSNGHKWTEGHFVHGKLNGLYYSWHRNGKKEDNTMFDMGKIIYLKCWDKKGIKKTNKQCGWDPVAVEKKRKRERQQLKELQKWNSCS